jgi:hypothetical protein
MFAEDQWLPLIRAIDERLEPIAKQPVDIMKSGWVAKLRNLNPLDEAGVRPGAEELLQKLIHEYASGDDPARATIRALFNRFRSFAWATGLRVPKTTAAGIREHLLHFSILDQGRDPRDSTLWLDDLVEAARGAGVDVNPILKDVASLSSRQDRYSWGSTAEWLLRRVV